MNDYEMYSRVLNNIVYRAVIIKGEYDNNIAQGITTKVNVKSKDIRLKHFRDLLHYITVYSNQDNESKLNLFECELKCFINKLAESVMEEEKQTKLIDLLEENIGIEFNAIERYTLIMRTKSYLKNNNSFIK